MNILEIKIINKHDNKQLHVLGKGKRDNVTRESNKPVLLVTENC